MRFSGLIADTASTFLLRSITRFIAICCAHARLGPSPALIDAMACCSKRSSREAEQPRQRHLPIHVPRSTPCHVSCCTPGGIRQSTCHAERHAMCLVGTPGGIRPAMDTPQRVLGY